MEELSRSSGKWAQKVEPPHGEGAGAVHYLEFDSWPVTIRGVELAWFACLYNFFCILSHCHPIISAADCFLEKAAPAGVGATEAGVHFDQHCLSFVSRETSELPILVTSFEEKPFAEVESCALHLEASALLWIVGGVSALEVSDDGASPEIGRASCRERV